MLADARFAGKLPLFGGVDGARFRRQVGPGDTLDLEVELGRMSARAGKGHGRAPWAARLACEADLLFVLVDARNDRAVDELARRGVRPARPEPLDVDDDPHAGGART